ncbi:CbtA family protein, partial [Methylogaea oryzae]
MSLRFGRIAACAALAGILASLPLTLAQAWWVTPLILQAETYEDAQAGSDSLHHDSAAVPSETLVAGEAAWQPEDGWQRTLSTAAANGALGIGHALILVGLFSLRRPLGVKQGLAW